MRAFQSQDFLLLDLEAYRSADGTPPKTIYQIPKAFVANSQLGQIAPPSDAHLPLGTIAASSRG
jgi:hypothetical protein